MVRLWLFMYKCFERCGKYPFGKIKEINYLYETMGGNNAEIPFKLVGFKLGLLDAVGKTGLYTFVNVVLKIKILLLILEVD